MWDLTGYPEWVCALKAGANAYQPIDRGAIVAGGNSCGASIMSRAACADRLSHLEKVKIAPKKMPTSPLRDGAPKPLIAFVGIRRGTRFNPGL